MCCFYGCQLKICNLIKKLHTLAKKKCCPSTSALGITLCVLLVRFSISTWSFWFMNKGKAAINVIKVKYRLLIGSLLLPQQFQGSLLDKKLTRLNHEESVQILHFHNSHIMTEKCSTRYLTWDYSTNKWEDQVHSYFYLFERTERRCYVYDCIFVTFINLYI